MKIRTIFGNLTLFKVTKMTTNAATLYMVGLKEEIEKKTTAD